MSTEGSNVISDCALDHAVTANRCCLSIIAGVDSCASGDVNAPRHSDPHSSVQGHGRMVRSRAERVYSVRGSVRICMTLTCRAIQMVARFFDVLGDLNVA
jgi:hypothetical protein